MTARRYRRTSGSSPRMRGTHILEIWGSHQNRFIPAYAGNTLRRMSIPGRRPVHPRVCGEHDTSGRLPSVYIGSSPRMRGTRNWKAHTECLLRFIPAYAGNTRPAEILHRDSAVHPRVCGEHSGKASRARISRGSSPRMRGTLSALGRFSSRKCGSSPRMRGTPHAGNIRLHHERFIPAYAGNTVDVDDIAIQMPVHPRVCGEHLTSASPDALDSGSSPRMRGTLQHCREDFGITRFIPAYAGNTAWFCSCDAKPSVHPRVCGEHARYAEREFDNDGSSPRMRGTRETKLIPAADVRFIPAYAGNTQPAQEFHSPTPVHPRVCGEHSKS